MSGREGEWPPGAFSPASHAFCSGCEESGDRPSIVVMDLPATSLNCVWQENARLPSMCTMQAPHMPAPQPNFVPESLSSSRMTQRRGVALGASLDAGRPLIVNWTIAPSLFPDCKRIAERSGTPAAEGYRRENRELCTPG